jgi:hypothetical protein
MRDLEPGKGFLRREKFSNCSAQNWKKRRRNQQQGNRVNSADIENEKRLNEIFLGKKSL